MPIEFKEIDIVSLVSACLSFIGVCVWPSVALFFLAVYRKKIGQIFDYITNKPPTGLTVGPLSVTWADSGAARVWADTEKKGISLKVKDKKLIAEFGEEEEVEVDSLLAGIIANELNLEITNSLVHWMFEHNIAWTEDLTSETIDELSQGAIEMVRKKYPEMTIRHE